MAKTKLADAFGLDPALLKTIDWSLALKRIIHDLRSDFIYAPHLAFVYARAGDKLTDVLVEELGSGTFHAGLPLTIEVPKSARMRVAVGSKRPGPNFSRPGSILLPRDRLLYQALADQAAPIIDAKTDHTRSFSHRLADPASPNMFLPTRTCWNHLQKAIASHAKDKAHRYVIKIDVADFFGSMNQHTLINTLNDYGYPSGFSSRLEALLTSYTGERSSRGILQGIYPSDLFGNFYLAPIDQFLDDHDTVSVRYVDDFYIFVDSVDTASAIVETAIPIFRSYDLSLNEAKCVIMPKAVLMTEEPDLEELFLQAVEEISAQVGDEDFDADYGFQSEWEEEDEGEKDQGEEGDAGDELELKATELLFDSIENHPGQEENIERFCLPLFSKAGSDYAVQHVMDAFRRRPSMSQIYVSYLAKFLKDKHVYDSLVSLLEGDALSDWQKMWVIAGLLQSTPGKGDSVKLALAILRDTSRHDALRAVAAIFVGRHGDAFRRKALNAVYPNVSSYVQAAILYSSRYWPSVERANARATWGGHTPLHTLVTAALAKK